MKKYISTLFIALAGLVLVTACDNNQPPVFDDANAFVAFDKNTASIDEALIDPETGEIVPQTGILRLPVTLGSVAGLKETVKFTVEDGTAKAGVNYRVLTTSGTLSFDATNRTQYIEVEPIYCPDYTGDLKFTITLAPTASVSLGYMSTCTVTIGDVDHPLSGLIGDYLAESSLDAYTNPWTMTLYKDENDDHMVWFFDIFANPGWSIATTMFYGNVDDNIETINIPYGQTSEYKYGGSVPVTLYWLNADDEEGKTGSVTAKIIKDADGKITGLDFGEEYGFYGLLEDLGWIGYAYPQITAVKQ